MKNRCMAGNQATLRHCILRILLMKEELTGKQAFKKRELLWRDKLWLAESRVRGNVTEYTGPLHSTHSFQE